MAISRRGFLGGLLACSGFSFAGCRLLGGARKRRSFRYAVNLNMWFRGDFVNRLKLAKDLGFDAVEMWEYQEVNMDAVARSLEDLDLEMTQFTAWDFSKELNHPKMGAENFVQAIESACRLALRLKGCERFTVVFGDDIEGFSREEMHLAGIEKLKKVVPILERYRKMIILEPMNPFNHPRHSLYGSVEGIKICQSVGSKWVKLNWDLFHMQRFEGNLIDYLRRGWDYVGYLQIADSPNRVEPSEGEVNFSNVLRVAKNLGYDLPVGLECFPSSKNLREVVSRIDKMDSAI